MSNPNKATLYMNGSNSFVTSMQFASDVATSGICKVDIDVAPAALNATGFLAAVDNTAAATAYATWATTYTAAMQADSGGLAKYGRNVTLVCSGTSTAAVTVKGRDYLQQPMAETFALNGATPVPGKKAFKWVDSVTWAAAGATRTMDMGWGDILGLPYCSDVMIKEELSNAPTSNAGTFAAGVKTDPATATTGDPKGTYAPHASNATDGSRTYQILVICDKTKLHGIAHYYV